MSRTEGRLLLAAIVVAAAGALLCAYAGTARPEGTVLDGFQSVWTSAWLGGWVFPIAARITLALTVAAIVLTVLERVVPQSAVRPSLTDEIRAHARGIAPIDAGTDAAVAPSRQSSRPPPPAEVDLGSREEIGLSTVAEHDLEKLLLTPHGLILVGSRQSDLAAHIGTVIANRRGLIAVHTIASREAATHVLGRARDRLVVAPIVAPDAPAAIGAFAGFAPSPAEAATHLVGALAVVAAPALCPSCRERKAPDDLLKARFEALGLELAGKPLFDAKGCAKCGGRGSVGERNVAELVVVDPPIRRALASGKGTSSIAMVTRAAGHVGLREELLARVVRAEIGVDDAIDTAESLR